MPNNTPLKSIAWNQEKGWIACGGGENLLKVIKLESGKGEGGGNLSMNQTLSGHSGVIDIIVWNENYQKLTTSDEKGLIIVWMFHKGQWFEEMINNRNKSVVRDMKWTSNGEKICIVYEDGAVIVGSVEGNRLWGKELDHEISHIEWSPDCKLILFGTPKGDVVVHDYVGNFLFNVKLFCFQDSVPDSSLADLQWFESSRVGYSYGHIDKKGGALCIAYKSGKIQLMNHEQDDYPIAFDTMLSIECVRWNPNGNILAVSGVQIDASEKKAVVNFYNNIGDHLRTLRVPSSSGVISSLSWEGFGLRMSLAVDSAIIFANIQPNYLWAYFNNTLVFSFQKPDKNDMTIVFWDSVVNEKHVRTMKGLLHIKAAGEYCILVSELEESKNEYILILSNAVGCPVESKTININPRYVAMNTTHVIVCSDDTVYYWQYRSQYSQSISLESDKKKKAGKESAFHIDEIPNPNTIYDKQKWKNPKDQIYDPICSVAAGRDGFIVGRSSGQVYQYTLPYIHRNENKYLLKCKPQTLSLNSNCTKFAIIDINGVLTFFDMEECPPGSKVPGYHKPEEKKEVWSVIWSSDNPDMCALMEKNRMFVMRNFKQEEPVLSSGYLCHFSDLEVKAAMLDDILKSPEEIKNISDFIESYECRSLRDTRDHLTTISLKDAVDFVDENPHPRLWKLIAEAALDKLDFQIAEKAFVKIEDYHGIKFLKRLKNIDDKYKQKAEISAYFNKFDEAEQIYREIDRKDLAMDLRIRLGDWSKVVTLIEQGVGDDEILKEAYNKMGEFCIDKQRWNKAAFYFQQSNNFEALIDVYYRLEQFTNMDKLIDDIPATSPALIILAEKMQSIGLCESAVKAYIKSNDVKKAIDCCVLLNQWNQAVELAEQHNFLAIEQLLTRYATHLIQKDKKMEAVELYRKANKNTESARLLAEIAQKLQDKRAPPLMIKKIYVLAAFEIDSYKQRVFDASMTQITGGGNTADATAKTLNSLITTDINSSADKALSNPWKGAEAIHFYLLCQRQLYQKEYNKAMKTAIRLMEYEKELDTKEVYSLIALAAYHNKCYKECSKAFIKLERSQDISKYEREKYESIAL